MDIKLFLEEMKSALVQDNFSEIDALLQTYYSHDFGEQDISYIEEILTEITLYSELKEDEYKQKALELLQNL